MKDIGMNESEWYTEATGSREGWRAVCSLGIGRNTEAQTLQRDNAQEVECDVCSRKFRRESDMKRHKCLDERSKPLCEQKGSTQCQTCNKWFKSRGGLAVHKCRPPEI